MIVALLLATAAAPTLEDIAPLAPAAAGELALAGYPHAPIVEVRPGPGGLLPQGVAELTMVERPVVLGTGGCMRHQWTVAFSRAAQAPGGPQRLTSAYPRVEVALRSGEACPGTGYVGVNAGLSPAVALAELARLRRWEAGDSVPAYRCVDRTYSDFCASADRTWKEVAHLTPWMVSRDVIYIELWLGTPGGIVTVVRYIPGERVSAVTVTRSVPAPF